jgi:Mn2+/Fe2+ NRAMP family transporter
MLTTIIIAPLMTILGIVILSGKGDMLIAGYNTASKEEREKYDIRRLRLVLGILMILIALASLLFLEESLTAVLAFGMLVIVLIIPALMLANTWAKKRK